METQTQAHKFPLSLEFDNVSTLPDSYEWSTTTFPSDDPCHYTNNDRKALLPVIDIGEPGAYDLVRHACEKWGTFQFINHGVPLTVFRETELYELVPATNGSDQTQCLFHLNSYSVCPNHNRAMGLAPHTDTSLIIVVNHSNISGLQVYQDGAGWVPVELVEGALVVNVGNLMQTLTNGKFKSVLHRVVVNSICHRLATSFFLMASSDAKISPLRKLVNSSHPPLYRAVTGKEYFQLKYKFFNKALESIRLKK
ncbi:hypothetical protein GQ457_10G011620 [Hibiscus cannabinus]